MAGREDPKHEDPKKALIVAGIVKNQAISKESIVSLIQIHPITFIIVSGTSVRFITKTATNTMSKITSLIVLIRFNAELVNGLNAMRYMIN